jgi:hypothetical protein
VRLQLSLVRGIAVSNIPQPGVQGVRPDTSPYGSQAKVTQAPAVIRFPRLATTDNPRPRTIPTIDATVLHRLSPDESLRFVDETLGPPSSWPSPLISYRLADAFQAPWKCELGQWLYCAKQYGFLEQVLHQLRTQAKRAVRKYPGQHPNDERHLKLHNVVAASRVVHYLSATGWSFVSYESETGGPVDIDVTMRGPGNELVELQVKSPDQPGVVEEHRLTDGENDERVLTALKKGASQLRTPATACAFIVVCANRNLPLAWTPHVLSRLVIGRATCIRDVGCFIPPDQQGLFFTDSWEHVSGVVMLDVAFGIEQTVYPCTVLLNPCAIYRATSAWFPYARVLELKEGAFRWLHGEPQHPFLPDGTQLGAIP